jgi:eukaryotic-like serine/threonine-protein kinase
VSEQSFGRYIIESELGRGGTAVVYRALDPATMRQVAVKVLTGPFASDPLFKDRFRREAQVLAALEHACIVPIFDVGEQGGNFYIVMRYMTGGSLEEKLKAGPIKARQLSPIIERVASALDATHVREIVHRDLKPANILFDDQGQAFLTDFGIAQTNEPPTGVNNPLFFGTPAYMSPEQVRSEQHIDGRSDIYSLGCVLFRALAGHPPFEDPSIMQIALSHLSEEVPKVTAVRHELPGVWDEIIGRAMAKERDARYPTAGELAREVKDAATGRWFYRKLES